MKITQTKDIRVANRLTIFNKIMDQPMVSRSEVSEQAKLNKATVSSIVKEWIDLGVLTEIARGDSTGGRKPIMLQQVTDAGYCIGIDMDVTKMRVVVTDLHNQMLQSMTIPLVGNQFISNYKQLYLALDKIISSMPSSSYGLVGIGVSVRGIVDLDGVIRFFPNLKWRNIDIKNLLQNRYHVPIYVENDGNLAAYSEMKHHADYRDIALLSITDVLSAGLIIDGKVLRGCHGFANAVGHHTVNFMEETQCACGKYGCWEQYCSNSAILAQMNRELSKPISRIEEFIAMVNMQEPVALRVLDGFVHHLAVGLSNIIFLLDSEVLILNSVVISSLKYLVPQILKDIVLPITQTQDIVISELGENSAILGACDHCIQIFYENLASGVG